MFALAYEVLNYVQVMFSQLLPSPSFLMVEHSLELDFVKKSNTKKKKKEKKKEQTMEQFKENCSCFNFLI